MTAVIRSVVLLSSIGHPREKLTWSGTTRNLVEALERQGIEVVAETVSLNRHVRRLFSLGSRLRGWGSGEPDRVGVLYRYLQRAASAIAARSRPKHFIHVGSSHLPIIAPRPGDRHWLLTDYNMHLLMTRGPTRGRVTDRYAAAVLASERAVAERCDGVFTVADYVRNDWIAEYGLSADKVVSIGTGLGSSLDLDGHVKDHAGGHLLYVGKHGFATKGGPLLLAGFAHALKTRPHLRLVIIADPTDPTLAPHMPAIRANPAIDFRQTGTPDFVELVRGAALYASPAVLEPWGLIYLESLMVETPVLGLDRGAMRQLTDGGRVGFLVDEETPEAVGDAIVDAMSDSERLARMGREGRQFVETNFTWDRTAARIVAALSR